MEQRSLKVFEAEKTFFARITNTISKLLIPTRVGINGMLVAIKRNSLLKSYQDYIEMNTEEKSDKKDIITKKYEDIYALYLESIDRYIMDSIYKKVKNDTATEFEKKALSDYYMITHLKETQYLEYKYKKQKYLIQIDYEDIQTGNKEKIIDRYNKFYVYKMDTIYKGLLKHYSIQLTDTLKNSNVEKEKTYDKIFETLEEYIVTILPIKMKYENTSTYKEILENYHEFSKFTVGKLDQKDYIEKKGILLQLSRTLFTHSLPLMVAEQCYVKLLKDTRSLIVDTKIATKKAAAYELLISLIEDYNIKLLSTKVYWDKQALREKYKKFWNEYKKLEPLKQENAEEYQKQKEILFIKTDLAILINCKTDYSKIIKYYKQVLTEYGVMKQIKGYQSNQGRYIKQKIA